MDKKAIRKQWEAACNAYADAFCEKHGFPKLGESLDTYWAGGHGAYLNAGDYTFSLQDVQTDIDEDAPEGEILTWYDYSLECVSLGLQEMNFHSWLAGAPRVAQESIERIKRMRKELDEAIEAVKRGGG